MVERAEKYAAAALQSACNAIASALKGQRNHTLNTESFGIGQLVGAGSLTFSEARTALLSAALSNGIDKHEAEASIKSGLDAGMKNPRDAPEDGARPQTAAPAKKSTADYAKQLYGEAKPLAGTLGERYLQEHRRLAGAPPDSFRFHGGVWHKGAGEKLPAMVAPITRTDATGTRITAVHITFLDHQTGAKTKADPAKKMYGSCRGGAIWLSGYAAHMLCAEGIEKGLACQGATGIPAAVGMSATLLPSIVWPRGTTHVTLCADPNGAGETAINKAASALAGDGVKLSVCYPPVPGKDWDELPATQIKAAIEAAKPWEAPKATVGLPKPEHVTEQFKVNDAGQILKNEGNVLLAMKWAQVALTYDEFADRYFVQGLPGYGPWLTDHALDELYLLIQREFHFKPSKDDFDRIVLAAARRQRFHPVKQYLDSLEWDGAERIDTWLISYGGAEDDAFTRAVARIVLIAAVRRIRKPGAKFDEMLVIEGEQGTLKSSAIAALSPKPEWVSDSLSLSVEERIIIEQTAGKWIVEIGELSGYRKREVEHIKAFLSRQTDSARLAYGRLRIDRPREFILIGTTNESNYLIDDTGDRRFWPVRIERFDIDKLLADRDQLWAEAAYWEAQGESIRLPQELWPDAAERQAERKEVDAWTDILAQWLDAEEKDPRSLFSHDYTGFRITLADVAKGALGIERAKLDTPTQKRIGRCLKAAGWVMAQRSHGKRFWRRADVE